MRSSAGTQWGLLEQQQRQLGMHGAGGLLPILCSSIQANEVDSDFPDETTNLDDLSSLCAHPIESCQSCPPLFSYLSEDSILPGILQIVQCQCIHIASRERNTSPISALWRDHGSTVAPRHEFVISFRRFGLTRSYLLGIVDPSRKETFSPPSSPPSPVNKSPFPPGEGFPISTPPPSAAGYAAPGPPACRADTRASRGPSPRCRPSRRRARTAWPRGP